jgi:DNA-binding MarR family transcriptional regulator
MTKPTGAKRKRDLESSLHAKDKLELRVWLRLLTCSTLIERQVRTGLRREFETTLPRFDILAQLERAPDGMTMGQLSSHLMVSNGNVTGLIDRLAQEDLVIRATAPGDRRTQMVRLTERGQEALKDMLPVHEAWIVDLMAGLDRQDMANLLDLLARLKGSLEASLTQGENG